LKPSTTACSGLLLLLALLVLITSSPGAAAARCHVSDVSYAYPHQANPGQLIMVDTTVTGSCVSTGDDYYSLRVDLVDMQSNSIAINSTAIGYFASNFTVVGEDSAVTPSVNGTWPLQVHVYVIRAGGTSGSTLLDYQTVSNVTIVVGTSSGTPVPEFNYGLSLTIIASLAIGTILSRTNGRKRTSYRVRQADVS
jgi:hypothetical protein